MKLTWRSILIFALWVCLSIGISGEGQDEEIIRIRPSAVHGDGIYNNSLQLLIDGQFVSEESPWNGERCIYWEDEETYFVIDLGQEYVIYDIRLQVSDDDDYQIDYSLDGEVFEPMFVLYEGYGETGAGMDTLSSDPSDPSFAHMPTLEPVTARYLRVSATGGDKKYSLAEIEAYGYREISDTLEETGGVLLEPVMVEGFGQYSNRSALIIDGEFPPEESGWNEPDCVFWVDTETYFVIDLGEAFEVTGITAQISSQDTYQVDYSLDNEEYLTLVEFKWSDGEFSQGMDTVSTVPDDPEYTLDLDFFPVRARYIKIYAIDGDGAFSLSELQVFGNSVYQ